MWAVENTLTGAPAENRGFAAVQDAHSVETALRRARDEGVGFLPLCPGWNASNPGGGG